MHPRGASGDVITLGISKASLELLAGFTKKTPANGAISMIDGKVKGGYPIVNYEYAIVNSNQSSPSTAKDIRSLLEWIVNAKDGNASSYLTQVNFQPLPASIVAASLKQIKTIQK